MDRSLISCKGLEIGYRGNSVISGINFDVIAGEYLCIVGENGVGKSTFIKTVLNLIPALSGEISFEDGLKPTDIGYLPQQTQLQKDFPASVLEVVVSGCLNKCGLRPFYNKAERELAKNCAKKMGIENLLNKSYSKLSGGQQQRTLLARALCATNKVLLLDEPATGLDSEACADMYKLIRSLCDEGITIIMITHDIKTAVDFADRVLYLSDTAAVMSADEYREQIMEVIK